jgi:hypothetical protein
VKRIGSEIRAMETAKLFTLIATALAGLVPLAWAGPHGGEGGFAGGAHFGGSHFGGYSGAPRGVPGFSGGARFSGQGIGGLSRSQQQFSYYGDARTSSLAPRSLIRQLPNRSITRYSESAAAISRQQNRAGSLAGRTRVSDPTTSTTRNRQLFNMNHALERHDANWHRNWDRRHAHFHNGHVFVFVNGFWYGFFPWDYFPYYAYNYPYDYYGNPYDYYSYPDDSYPSDYGDQPALC